MEHISYCEIFLAEYKGYFLPARKRQHHLKKILDERHIAFSRKEAKKNARQLMKIVSDFKVVSYKIVSGGWVKTIEDDCEPEDPPEDLLREMKQISKKVKFE